MKKITDADIESAIRKCHWRINIAGVPICGGNCNVCSIEIERGRCVRLQELFGRQRVDIARPKGPPEEHKE